MSKTTNPLLSGAAADTSNFQTLDKLNQLLKEKQKNLKEQRDKLQNDIENRQVSNLTESLTKAINTLNNEIENHPETKIKECVNELDTLVQNIDFTKASIAERSGSSELPEELMNSINEEFVKLEKIKNTNEEDIFNKIILGLKPDSLATFSFLSEDISENEDLYSALSQPVKNLINAINSMVESDREASMGAMSRDKQSGELKRIFSIKDVTGFKNELGAFLEIISQTKNLEKVGEKYETSNDFQKSHHFDKVESIIIKCRAIKDQALEKDVINYLEKAKEACKNTETKVSASLLKGVSQSAKRLSRIFVSKSETPIMDEARRNSTALTNPLLVGFKQDPEYRLNVLQKLIDSSIIDRGFFLKIFSEIAIAGTFEYSKLDESLVNKSYKEFCNDLDKIKNKDSLNSQLPDYSDKTGVDVFVSFFDQSENITNVHRNYFNDLNATKNNRSSISSDRIKNLQQDLINANTTNKVADRFVAAAIAIIEPNLADLTPPTEEAKNKPNPAPARNRSSLSSLFGKAAAETDKEVGR